ncbi:MAG: hypothetical protein PHN18_05650 [Sulfurospirillaceae bacterium]|jgi:hypothetical protein|nr:hypothetical protein [Sulfurospirillaceae bacterium]MDD2825795.1 hypothetical protein [Sulfurospirillaceae bacterium]
MKVSLATEMAPPFGLVAHFFITGIVFLLLSAISFIFLVEDFSGYFISLHFAAFAHLYLLGFVMMIIFGAMYQLLPVVLEAPIFSKDFAYVQFYLYLIGLVMMIGGFTFDNYFLFVPYGGVITYLSIIIFCMNVFLTFKRLDTINIVGKYLLVATAFLALSVTLGLIVGLSLGHGLFEISVNAWVQAHMIGALGGFVMMIVMGVSMVLIPMFSLSHGFNDRWIRIALPLHTVGILSAMLSFLFELSWLYKSIALGVTISSIVLYIIQMFLILKYRVRKQNDYWIKNSVFALLALVLSMGLIALSIVTDNTSFSFAGGFLLLFGFILCFIVGHIYKILPFLVWYDKFSPLVGKQKVPLLHQMVHTKIADIQTFSLVIAIGGLTLAIAFNLFGKAFLIGSLLMLVSICLVIYNIGYIFIFKIKDEI